MYPKNIENIAQEIYDDLVEYTSQHETDPIEKVERGYLKILCRHIQIITQNLGGIDVAE